MLPDQNRRRAFEKLQQRLPPECRLLDRCMGRIEADNVKDCFANVDAEDGCISWLVAYAHNYLLLSPPNVHGRTGRIIPLSMIADGGDEE